MYLHLDLTITHESYEAVRFFSSYICNNCVLIFNTQNTVIEEDNGQSQAQLCLTIGCKTYCV